MEATGGMATWVIAIGLVLASGSLGLFPLVMLLGAVAVLGMPVGRFR
jgi:hypothetical protein